MRLLRVGLVASVAITLFGQYGFSETQCPTTGTDGKFHTVEEGLNWCSGNHGFNEGGWCGVQALAGGAIPANLEPILKPALGNSWDRTNMIGAARTAIAAGRFEEAVSVGVCCQIHNPHMHKCLSENRPAVRQWFSVAKAFDELQAKAAAEYKANEEKAKK